MGKVNATLPEGHNPETISLAEAIALIDSKAKKAPARKSAKKSAVKRSGKVIPAEADA